MVTVSFKFEITGGNDDSVRFIGMNVDEPLPSRFWEKGYAIGIGWIGDTFTVERNISPGRHYVIVGTSSDPNYLIDGQPAHMKVWITVGGTPSFAPVTVHRNQYGYMVFDLSSAGTVTAVAGGHVAPDQVPPGTGTGTNYTLTLVVERNGAVDVTVDGSTTRYSSGVVDIVKPNGTAFRLDAVPNTNYIFDGWFDDGTRISGSPTLTFNLTSSITRRATFKASTTPPSGTYILTIYVSSGGKLLVNGTPYTNTAAQLQFTAGSLVTLEAVPDDGYKLRKFLIDSVEADLLMSTKITITMNADHIVDVGFTSISDGGDTDWSKIVQDMTQQMMRIMVPMMGMMMMVQMMTGLIGSLTAGGI